jgi:hypothetical protein
MSGAQLAKQKIAPREEAVKVQCHSSMRHCTGQGALRLFLDVGCDPPVMSSSLFVSHSIPKKTI